MSGKQNMTMTVDVTSNLSEVKKEAESAIERALTAVGLQAEGYAKLLCPVDTGRLRNSIVYATEKSQSAGEPPAEAIDSTPTGRPPVGAVVIGTNVEYAQEVEEGSSQRKPKPYLKPAISDHVDEYKRMIEDFLKGKQG